MKDQSYTTTIEITATPQEVFDRITAIPKWWSTDFEGSSVNSGDEFVIHHPDAHFSRQKLVEVIPGEKMVWQVTDSNLDWLEKNQHEWTNTRMIFELMPQGNKTVLHFTHQGLVPELECYERCTQGWSMVIGERLFNFITTGETI
jgi:uncharacterized protein YndB with AHSA1/START domain